MQSRAGRAVHSASQRSEENLSQEQASFDTPLKRNLELPAICPPCHFFLPFPSSAPLLLLCLVHLSPAKHLTHSVMFQRQKSPNSSPVNNRHHPEDSTAQTFAPEWERCSVLSSGDQPGSPKRTTPAPKPSLSMSQIKVCILHSNKPSQPAPLPLPRAAGPCRS